MPHGIKSYDAYTETIQDNNKVKDEISQLKYDHEKQMEGMSQQIDRLESTISRVFSKISGGITQLTGIDSIDKKLMKKYKREPDKIKCLGITILVASEQNNNKMK